ncbi:MAG: DUF2141 domain-containing protein [Acidimicrobiales bacterium]|nr:DUF2141 domain-containing protein [Hyphomonadaceae bacterium]RZV41779.1 MAG: DUF2141 domain-containing protein [Acidimicrobiales bacterium]
MTHSTRDTNIAPARRLTRNLLVAVNTVSLMAIAATASAQNSIPVSASAQQTAAQAQTPNETQPVVEDKFKPRVYGGTPPVVETPAPAQPKTDPVQTEQQVNLSTNDLTVIPSTNDAKTEAIGEVNPNLPSNAALNSAPNWPNGIRKQFIDVIVGAPIMKDPTSCEDGNPSLRIKVSNVKNSKGIIVADLHDDVKENFLDWEKVVLRVRATAVEDETFFCMPVPEPGNYSVAIYHDKNSNAFFDKNFLGLPKERFGMSNNPKFTTKSPKFEEATFAVPAEGVDMEIKLRRTKDVISGNQD